MYKTNRYRGKRIPTSIPALKHVFKRYGQVVTIANAVGGPSNANNPPTLQGPTGWILGNTTADTFPQTSQMPLNANFMLSQVLNNAEFVALYDRYKIIGVKLKFLYQCSVGQDQTNFGASGGYRVSPLPILDYTVDFDDANQPTSRAQIQQHGYCKTKVLQANQPFSLYIKPRVTYQAFSLNGGAFGSTRSMWLDCASNDIEHYGLKCWLSSWPYDQAAGLQGPQAANGCLTIQPIFYLAFKDSQ